MSLSSEIQGNLASFIDSTLLKADATLQDIQTLCLEAIKLNCWGVCINSNFIKDVRRFLDKSSCKVISTLGFPLGANLTEAKVQEAKLAIEAGAEELDMVMAIGPLLDGQHQFVEQDIQHVVIAAEKLPVKVIIETSLLNKEQIVLASKICESAGAAFVKTSTGFGSRGASIDDIKTIRSAISSNIKIKASGGIKTKEQAIAFIEAGADRIGTSHAKGILT